MPQMFRGFNSAQLSVFLKHRLLSCSCSPLRRLALARIHSFLGGIPHPRETYHNTKPLQMESGLTTRRPGLRVALEGCVSLVLY